MMRAKRILNAATMGCVIIQLGLGLTGCDRQRADTQEAATSHPLASRNTGHDNAASTAADHSEKKSIIRSDIEQAPAEAPVLVPQTVVVPFPEKGAQPDDAGIALIDQLIASPEFNAEGPITIWGHSDSAGSDTANLLTSRRRAEAVSAYLQGKGVAKDRITVIAIGEGRPIAPNRKLDGSEDTEGRRKNRRVEIRLDLPSSAAAAAETTNEYSSPK